MQSSHRIYLRVLGICLGTSLVVLAVFNILVDPLGAYPAVSLKSLQPYRGHLSSRAAKAEMIAHGEADVLLAGTSRVESGLPMDHPGYGSERVYNMGLRGTTLPEMSAALDFAVKHNHLKRIYLGVDFFLFSDVRGVPHEFENSRFNPSVNLIEYHARNLFGWQTANQSVTLLRRTLRHGRRSDREHGFVGKHVPAGFSQRVVFEKRIRNFLIDREIFAGYHYSPEFLQIFRGMVRSCRNNGIELIVFIPPIHALQLETVRAAGLWTTFEQWKTDMTRIVAEESGAEPIPFWDFTGYRGPVTENVPPIGDRTSRMKYYTESSHFTPALGSLVVDRLSNHDDAEASGDQFGVRLTMANLEPHLRQLRADREAYAASHPDEVAWVQEIAASSKGQVATEDSDS